MRSIEWEDETDRAIFADYWWAIEQNEERVKALDEKVEQLSPQEPYAEPVGGAEVLQRDRHDNRDEYTDDLTDADLYGIQTQCNKVGNWFESQIQLSVLVPFHFIPADDPEWQWKTTEDGSRAREVMAAAVATGDPNRIGIALHAYQDTFSHQGFSGWLEERNACYPWFDLSSALPDVGHTEMMTTPGMIDQVWTDPRTKQRVDNGKRAIRAAKATFGVLAGL
jgi:hypothetical protein